VAQVEYVSLDNKNAGQKVKAVCTLQQDELQSLAEDVGQRLDLLANRIQQGTAMPAWGDEKTCEYCQMSGVCRREAWVED
jgi:ATP-dependent helicase/nuclease subunit B